MTYEEHLHRVCNAADLKDEEQVTILIQYLLHELLENRDLAEVLDDKLQELMTAKDYDNFAKESGKELFLKEVDRMEDCDFKRFILDNLDDLTDLDKIFEEKDYDETIITI